MRIWHEELIPYLCRQHLLAMWREGLGAYSIIVNSKKGYSNHPAVKEFNRSSFYLYLRLAAVRDEMIRRGYHPKDLPDLTITPREVTDIPRPWQDLKTQIHILENKGCECQISKVELNQLRK